MLGAVGTRTGPRSAVGSNCRPPENFGSRFPPLLHSSLSQPVSPACWTALRRRVALRARHHSLRNTAKPSDGRDHLVAFCTFALIGFDVQIELEALRLYGLPEAAPALLCGTPVVTVGQREFAAEVAWDRPSLAPGIVSLLDVTVAGARQGYIAWRHWYRRCASSSSTPPHRPTTPCASRLGVSRLRPSIWDRRRCRCR